MLEVRGKIKGGSTKTKKINEESVNFFQFKVEAPIGEDDLRKLDTNGADVIFSKVPFPFEKMSFGSFTGCYKIKVLQLDEENEACGDEKEFVDVIINGYEYNVKTVPKIIITFLIPTAKNLVEGLLNMSGNIELKIES